MVWSSGAEAARLKDIASIKGVRPNQLIGYGLVVGLNGTGDGASSAFTVQSLASLLSGMGITLDAVSYTHLTLPTNREV